MKQKRITGERENRGEVIGTRERNRGVSLTCGEMNVQSGSFGLKLML